jgi:pimeloyl-ACP methyl ester carboxylesterase
MRTLIVGDKNKPILVLVHGYGSSAPMFYKLFKGLSQHFCIVCPDMIGMGGSSRPDNYKANMSPEDSIDYMVIHFEAWRRSLELKEFYLVAHSMGAYFSSNYALKYPQYVRRLILLSPVGLRVPLPDESWNRGTNTPVRNGAGPPDFNILTGASYKMLKLTPSNIGRFCGHALSK